MRLRRSFSSLQIISHFTSAAPPMVSRRKALLDPFSIELRSLDKAGEMKKRNENRLSTSRFLEAPLSQIVTCLPISFHVALDPPRLSPATAQTFIVRLARTRFSSEIQWIGPSYLNWPNLSQLTHLWRTRSVTVWSCWNYPSTCTSVTDSISSFPPS